MKKKILAGILSVLLSVTMSSPVRAETPEEPAGDEPEITEVQETEEPAETVVEEAGEADKDEEVPGDPAGETPNTEESAETGDSLIVPDEIGDPEDPAPVGETPDVTEEPEETEEPVETEEPEETEEPAPAEEEESAEDEITFIEQDGEYNGVTVHVGYTSDTFEKEVTLVVAEAGETEKGALDAAFDGDYKAVDISFIDEDGNKLQPLEGKSVEVSLSAEDMVAGTVQVMHVDGEGNIDFIEDKELSVSNGEVTTAEVEVLVPEMVEVPVYEEVTNEIDVPAVLGMRTVDITEEVTVPAEIGTRTVDITEDVTVPAEMGTRLVEKTREVEVPAVIGYRTVKKTRVVNANRSLLSILFPSLFKKTKTEVYYEQEPYVIKEAYTKTETYTEEEEYVVTPEHTETRVVGTREEEYVITPEHTETRVVGTREEEYVVTPGYTTTETVQVQTGTEWQETGEMVTETRTVNVNDIEVQFTATQFSTYAIRTNTIRGGQEYVVYTEVYSWDWGWITTYYALANDRSNPTVDVTNSGGNEIVSSDRDDIRWVFETNGTGYKISYSNNGTKTYLQATNNGLTTTTNQNGDRTTWYYANNRLYTGNGQSTRYLRYNGGWTTSNSNQASTIYLAQQQGGSGPGAGIKVHYVDADGNVIKTFTTDDGTAEYCDIAETINVATSSTDHLNTYTATSGTMYDLVFEIPGYTYDSTYLTSYISESSHGAKINAEVFKRTNGDWGYTNYGGDTPTGGGDYTEDIHDFNTITDVYVVYNKITSDEGGPDDPGDDDEELDAPATGKTVEDNDDGTSTLSLSIAGSSKDISKNTGANVIVIFDVSNSMTTQRMTEAKAAARLVATNLLGLNGTTPGNDPLVEMMLIYFSSAAHPSATETGTWYSTAGANTTTETTGFNGAVNALSNSAGTNWEAALRSAEAQAASHLAAEAQRPGRSDQESPDYQRVDDTYIIFITDGQPSQRVGTTAGSYNEASTTTFYTHSNYVRATDEARAIVEAGYEFYSIGIYGTIEVLHYLTDFALTGRSTYDTSKTATSNGNANGHFYNASTYSALTTALGEIANSITGKLAVAGVSFTDGIATSVTSTNISASNASGFKYTVTNAGGVTIYEVSIDKNGKATYKFGDGSDYSGETFEVANNASGTAGTGSNGTPYTATCETVTTSFDYTTPQGETGTKTSITTVYTVKIGDDEYKMSPASVDENGEVVWDLAGVGTIDSGYVWTVSFIIWPDQEAYDIVTDLNNGIETKYKWIDYDSTLDPATECAREQRDKNGNLLYWYEGVFAKDGDNWVKSEYTHIVKYPNGTYAALTNTHQDVQYFIYDDETGTYIGPVNHEITPPEPISLDAALATVQKKWEVDLDKEQLIYALFDTWTGESHELQVTMHVFEDHEGDDYDFADQYTQTTLGWQSDVSAYDWADETEDIDLYGRTYTIGTLWEDDLSIAVGVMIDEDKAEEYGLTDNAYAVINGKKYYVLEHGHDYDIVESGFQNYRFDYISHTYHPMLVDGDMYDLQNLRIGGTDEDGKQYYVFDAVEPMTALVAHNTLRGGINISKSVIDGDEEPYDTDTNFTFEITLDNPTEDVFVDDSIPWYAVTNGKKYDNGELIYFYYHDADNNLYQASGVTHDGETVTFTLYDEDGNSYAATSTTFAEQAGPADITYTKDGEEITIALYGNVLTVSGSNNKATATLTIPATDVIRIANVPYKTTYKINEVEVTGFELVEIEQTIQPSEDASEDDKTVTTLTGEVVEDAEIEAMKVREDSKLIGITDEIVPDNQNNIDFTNQTTEDAFYVYHSSDNTVEKILFADTRVNNEYDETNDKIVYQFNIANETKTANLYGGYYHSYAGAVATDDQITGDAESGNLVYAEDTSATMYDGTHTGGMWADDVADAKPYDYAYVAAVKAGTETGWASDYYTEKGTEMSPETDTVYYLKEVPDHYDLPYTHYTYNKSDKLLRNMWYITAIDDLKYDEVGFVIKLTNENGDVATIVDTLTVINQTGGATVTLTPKSVFGGNTTTKPVQAGYLGYVDEKARIAANTTSVFTPYWKTMDGVTVRGLTTRTINFNNGKVGTGGMRITNADTAAALLLADIDTGN